MRPRRSPIIPGEPAAIPSQPAGCRFAVFVHVSDMSIV
jgi:hypothetical protein